MDELVVEFFDGFEVLIKFSGHETTSKLAMFGLSAKRELINKSKQIIFHQLYTSSLGVNTFVSRVAPPKATIRFMCFR